MLKELILKELKIENKHGNNVIILKMQITKNRWATFKNIKSIGLIIYINKPTIKQQLILFSF